MLGITPAQQVRRLVMAAQAEGRTRFAAVLPQNPFGDALATGFTTAATEASLSEPRVVRHANTATALKAALKDVSDYTARHGPADDAARAARSISAATPTLPPVDTPPIAIPPPPIDALLLGAAGSPLQQAAPALAADDIKPGSTPSDGVRVLGPGIWSREATKLGALTGAWFAAPEPGAREPFNKAYAAKYGSAPRDFASLAYDAASIARVTADTAGFPLGSIERAEGFAGADGLLLLGPEGQVRRGLAIFEIDRTGAHVVQPAPQTATAPGV